MLLESCSERAGFALTYMKEVGRAENEGNASARQYPEVQWGECALREKVLCQPC